MNNTLPTLSIATASLHHDQLAETNHERFPRVDDLKLQKLLETALLNYSSYEKFTVGEFFRNADVLSKA
jgi:hypothetical protein